MDDRFVFFDNEMEFFTKYESLNESQKENILIMLNSAIQNNSNDRIFLAEELNKSSMS